MIVEGEGTSGDEVNTLLLDGSVGVKALLLGDLQQVFRGSLASPVRLERLLYLTLRTNAGETENGGSTARLASPTTNTYAMFV